MFVMGAQKVNVGDIVYLTKDGIASGLLGKAISSKGIIKATFGDSKIKVQRDGIKTPKWYHAGFWELENISDTGRQLQEAISESPDDYGRYQIYADYLEEKGQTELACAWRWMGHHKKRPFWRSSVNLLRRWVWYVEKVMYWDDKSRKALDVKDYSRLPALVKMAMGKSIYLSQRTMYPTEDDAINALAIGLKRLKEAVQ